MFLACSVKYLQNIIKTRLVTIDVKEPYKPLIHVHFNPFALLEIKNHSAKYQSDRVAHPGFNQRPISSFRIAQDLKVKIRQCI